MVLQSIQLGDDYQLLDPIPIRAPDQAFFPRAHALYTVNGVLPPPAPMYPGEVQRWRLLNAAESTFLSLHLNQHDFHVLAWDGLTLAEPDTTGVVMLSPGNRVDLLVRAGRPGRYDLVLTPGSSQQPDIPGMPGSAAALPGPRGMAMPGFPPFDEELKRADRADRARDRARPADGPAGLAARLDPPVLPISRRRNFAFTVQREPDHAFLSFGVDGVPYDPAAPPYRIPLGTAEEWTLVNAFDPKLMNHAHVFHIHVNPFRITRINGRVLDKPLWRDTFVLPKLAGDSLTFESNFTDFPGKFVEHCHMTSHEDLGMMSAIEVVALVRPARPDATGWRGEGRDGQAWIAGISCWPAARPRAWPPWPARGPGPDCRGHADAAARRAPVLDPRSCAGNSGAGCWSPASRDTRRPARRPMAGTTRSGR